MKKVRETVLNGDVIVQVADLKKAKKTRNGAFCPICKKLMYRVDSVYRCYLHGYFKDNVC